MDSLSTLPPITPAVEPATAPTTPSSDYSRKRRCNKACVYCNRSHISCEDARPCSRCVNRGIAHLCQDAQTSKRGRKSYLNVETKISTTPCSVASLLNQDSQYPTEIQYLLSDPLPIKKQTTSPQFTEMLTKKLSSSPSDTFLVRFREARKKMEKHLEKFSAADLIQVQEADALEAQVWTKKFEQMFNNMTVPTFVYDRNGSVRYVNPAYKALTGFSLNPPLGEHSFHACILAQSGLKDYFDMRFNLMENLCSLPPNGVMFKSSVRVYEKDASGPEKSMEGTMAFNFKVDHLNIPFLILGFFLPSNVANPLILDFHTRVNM